MPEQDPPPAVMPGIDLAGSRPVFPSAVGGSLIDSLPLSHFGRKHLLFGEFHRPGQVHVYSANCHPGERLRAQTLVPVLPRGGSVTPAIALVAQGLPYTADAQDLPLNLPKGYGTIVVHPPSVLNQPVRDLLTRARYYPGPLVDTRTLVGGRCYLVVWSPHSHMGKYVVQTGYAWPWQWTYWLQLPLYWWRMRGWFGLSRAAAYVAGLLTLIFLLVLFRPTKR